jgi:hypothetical protein
MKHLKLLIFSAIVFGAAPINAQISIGPQLGYSYSFSGIRNINLGIRGDYQLEDNSGIAVSLGYHLPYKFEDEISLIARSSTTPSAKVLTNDRISGIKLLANYKYYLGGTEYEDDFAFYALAGAGISFYTYKSTTEPFDQNLYSANGYEGDKLSESFLGFSLNAGIGAEFLLGDNPAFVELKLLLPANQANGQSIEVDIPTFFHLTAGYRFSL